MAGVPYPTMPRAVDELVGRAGRLSRAEIVRLDIAEREHAQALQVGWDLLRDRYAGTVWSQLRLQARTRAWAAVGASLEALDLPPVEDDGYWRVVAMIGAGAARAARYAACVMVAPDLLDDEVRELLLAPWRSVVAD